ncbi:MAG: PQQ-dependent sugar dehydrogenase, partial [Hyphomicrobiaceae bacterium]
MSGRIFLETSELSLSETDGQILVPVVRTGDLSQSVTIEFGITGIEATAGADFVAQTGTVTMAAGEDRATVTVQILDDALSEPTETVVVSLINVDSGFLDAPRTARVDILDDENPVTDPPSPPLVSDYEVVEEVAVSGLVQPVDIKFIDSFPDAPANSQMAFVAEKGGKIKVVDVNSGATVSEFVDISNSVNAFQDRGLLDIEPHPNFPAEPYLYAFYVVDPPESQGLTGNAGPDGGGNRYSYVVRFEADADNGFLTAIPGSETVLIGGAGQSINDISGNGAVDSTSDANQPESGIDGNGDYLDDYIKVDSRSHAGGALAFGPDGALYISIGDGTSFNLVDPRSASVQDINSLSGKILRVDPDTGLGLPDNPFADQAANLSSNAAKVYQLGLRNPFSMSFDVNGNLLITDTGWNSYEEINSGGPGANFGWPFFEGGDNGVLIRTPGYQNISGASDFYNDVDAGNIVVTPAFRAFSHDSAAAGYQVQSITGGGVVYTGDKYPDLFQNDYFFSDFSQGEVFTLDANDRRDVTFLYNGSGVVHFEQGPDGYVYYADIFDGEIGRLLISGGPTGAQPPVAINDDATTTPDDAAPIVDVLANDSNPGGAAADLFISAVDGSAANVGVAVAGNSGGVFTIALDGTATFDPSGDFDSLLPGASQSTSVEYVVRNPDGEEAFAVYTVNVVASGGGTDPAIAITTPLAGDGILDATEAGVDLTVSGTTTNVEVGQEVTVSLNAQSYTTPVMTGGAWSVDIPAVDLAALTDGIETLTANVSDASGNAAPEAAANLTVDISPTDGSTISIFAQGQLGSENMDLLIDGVVVATYENVPQAGEEYTYQAGQEITADQVRIAFTNDLYDPANGIDRNLIVDKIVIDGQTFETEDPSVFSTGTWLPEDGVQPGFGRGDLLHSNGYFQYADDNDPGDPTAELLIPDTTIDATEVAAVGFSVTGLDAGATGVVTFADGSNSVTVDVAADGAFVADLTPLNDGTITAALAITDAAGNSATVNGPDLTLDTAAPAIAIAITTP